MLPAMSPVVMSRSRRPRRDSIPPGNRASGRSAPETGSRDAGDTTTPQTAPDALAYATVYHAPVLASAVVDGLVTDRDGVYIDGTLGGGGHSAALLDALGANALVIGIDQDDEALATARTRLSTEEAAGRFRAVKGNFGDLRQLVANLERPITGILLDLGVSSHQIDDASRGFAFSASGPLDMRMDPTTGESARDLIHRLPADALADVIYQYGEERRSRAIARTIKAAAPETTGELAEAVRQSVPNREETKALARVFQALRIAVNREMDVLEEVLPAALDALAPGGRLAVIAYHSLEDRRAKQFLRTGRFSATVEKDLYGNPLTPWAPITRKAIVADEAEISQNPRARSARLRIAQKHLSPPGPSERHPGA
ncbi:MAG: 16S rRNA (cytosine(1402)-N(4))-methyltransferase RsmH [Rubricoccaceae bacterium]